MSAESRLQGMCTVVEVVSDERVQPNILIAGYFHPRLHPCMNQAHRLLLQLV